MLGRTRRVLWSSVVLQSRKMSVFHVFVLVLVMWAVHSHGRAYEAESITYNNTQLPYKENMNTGRIIPRPFDYSYLVLQWAQSFCNLPHVKCIPGIYNLFTLHGLWPQPHDGYSFDCRVYGKTAALDIGKLQRDVGLVDHLKSFWPSWQKGKPDEYFWADEYTAHGGCFFSRQEDYLTSIKGMMSHMSNVNRAGVRPGISYRPEDFRNLISGVTGFVPMLQCFKGTSYLYQIWFCAKSGALTNCPYVFSPNSNCWDGKVVLPLKRPRHGL